MIGMADRKDAKALRVIVLGFGRHARARQFSTAKESEVIRQESDSLATAADRLPKSCPIEVFTQVHQSKKGI